MSDIDLIWFQTTNGHFTGRDIYKYTLNNLKKNINLDYFNNKFLSLKVFNNDEYLNILKDFDGFNHFLWKKQDERINDESSYNDYGYYLIGNYITDIALSYCRISEMKHSKYIYLVEDDSPEIILSGSLQEYIEDSIDFLEENENVFSVNLRRYGRNNNEEYLKYEDLGRVDNFIRRPSGSDFQNQVFRASDMIKAAKEIRQNYSKYVNVHPESAVRYAIDNSSTIKRYFFTYLPEFAHSIHLGAKESEFLDLVKDYNLSKD